MQNKRAIEWLHECYKKKKKVEDSSKQKEGEEREVVDNLFVMREIECVQKSRNLLEKEILTKICLVRDKNIKITY